MIVNFIFFNARNNDLRIIGAISIEMNGMLDDGVRERKSSKEIQVKKYYSQRIH